MATKKRNPVSKSKQAQPNKRSELYKYLATGAVVLVIGFAGWLVYSTAYTIDESNRNAQDAADSRLDGSPSDHGEGEADHEDEQLSPSETLLAFYNGIILTHDYSGETPMEFYQKQVIFTDSFMKTLRGPQQPDRDPVICAQDLPTKFVVEESIDQTAKATVVMAGQYPDTEPNSFSVSLVRDQQLWKIDNITCPTHN